MRLALLHPGAMGASIGAALVGSGHQVVWHSEGRSAQTLERAATAGLESAASLVELLENCQGVISVCPPAEALPVADMIADAGFDGLYLDANAVAPDTARALHERFGDGFVDGGIIGPPAWRAGTTRLYLSGHAAQQAAGWFTHPVLGVQVVPGQAGAASALKMCYAAYTKGTSALLMAVRALAEAEGVTTALLEEWQLSQPDLISRSEGAARGTAGKAWRFVGEMEEIAATFEARDLPGGFHLAAADVYRRMSDLKEVQDPDLDQVIEMLLGITGKAR